MSDVRAVLERGVGGATPPPDGYERMLRRRDRKRRNQRIRAGVVGLAIALAAFAVGASIVRSSSTPATPPAPTPGRNAGGLTFAYGSRGVASGIALLEPGAAHPRHLVSGEILAFDWSPDGTELAYTLVDRSPGSPSCLLWLLDVDSGQSRKLTSCESAGGVDWAPDGTQIAFLSGGAIHVIAPDGTGERELATGLLEPLSATWSPDGRRIAFITGRLELFVRAGDTTTPIPVAPRILAAAWSPDGATIAILRDVPGRPDPSCRMCDHNVLQVWLIRPDGSNETKLAVQHGCCIGAQPTLGWSPDGSRIALTGNGFEVIEVATGTSRIVNRPGMIGSIRPSWRPVP